MPIVVQVEQGKRPISGLELQMLTYLFAKDIREFLADEFAEDDVVHALTKNIAAALGDRDRRFPGTTRRIS